MLGGKEMKRKWYLGLLVISICILLTGCTIGGPSQEKEKTPSGGSTGSQTSDKIEITEAKLKEAVIVDQNDVKVTAKSINYDGYFGPEIKLLIENNSNQDITVQTESFSINGIMMDPIFSEDVAMGKKANVEISIDNEDLELAKIGAIQDIEFSLVYFDPDSYDDLFQVDGIHLSTDATSYQQEYNTDGFLAVDQNGVKIYVLKLVDEDSVLGTSIYLYVQNDSSKDITVDVEDFSINGFMIDAIFATDILQGKKVYSDILILDEDLEKNDIKEIKDVELKFDVYDTESFDEIFKTDIVKVNF